MRKKQLTSVIINCMIVIYFVLALSNKIEMDYRIAIGLLGISVLTSIVNVVTRIHHDRSKR